jgi:small subunit ribosomal protein S6
MSESQAQPVVRQSEYETIYVLRQDVDPEAADRISNRVSEVMGRENGRLVKVENWGRRKLSYEVAKQKRGVYFYLKYLGGGRVVNELERNLRMLDGVVKFQTVRLRADVEVESLQIDPEEVKFGRVEVVPDEEKEESPERALGLVEPEPSPHRARHEGEPGEDEDGDDWVVPGKPKMSEPPPAPASGGGDEQEEG